MSRARLQTQLILTELLIALAEESALRHRVLAEQCGLQGEALGQAISDLAIVEASLASRKAERERLLAALAALPPAAASSEA